MVNKVRVYGKAQNRTALGIMHAYMVMYPQATMEDLEKAFPNELNPDSGVKINFVRAGEKGTDANWDGFFQKDDELLTAIILPPHKARTGSAYIKFATRQAMDLAVLGVAACCTADDDKALEKVTIALGVAGPTPLRCRQAEAYLEGRLPDDAAYVKAGELALKDASPRDSWRASKRYREALIRELTGRAVREAYELACRS